MPRVCWPRQTIRLYVDRAIFCPCSLSKDPRTRFRRRHRGGERRRRSPGNARSGLNATGTGW